MLQISEFKPLTTIKSKTAKNLLRGMIRTDEPKKVLKYVSRIERNENKNVLYNALDVIRNSILFENNGVFRSFIKKAPVSFEKNLVLPSEIIENNIKSESKRIEKLIDSYTQILKFIVKGEVQNALVSIEMISEVKGFSLFLARILFYLRSKVVESEVESDAIILKKIDSILNKVDFGNSRYLENAILELSNPRTDYFNISKRILEDNSENQLNIISRNFINHIIKNKEEHKKTLSAYYNYSLVDSVLYLLCQKRALPQIATEARAICPKIKESFKKLSSIKITEADISRHLFEGEQNLFKESFLLVELEESYKYKTVHSALYNSNDDKEFERTPYEISQISNYFKDIAYFNDLPLREMDTANISSFNKAGCCLLENSTALIYLLEKKDGDLQGNDELFVKLMSSTKNIGIICPSRYLENIERSTNNNELRLVVSCLISIKDKSNFSEFSLRRTLQEIAKSDYNSCIVKLIKKSYDLSPAVTEHLIHVCDETFISKLFSITDKPVDAIENRAEILEWYGYQTDDKAFIERAKNLRIDVQISKQKAAIDDSRIYVDQLKFTQWVNDNTLNKLTILFENTEFDGEIDSISIDWKNVHNGLSHNEQIGFYLLKSHVEFCQNNMFGLASYLGRRIRHGTLKGTGFKEVKELPSNPKYSKVFESDKGLSVSYYQWLKSYESMLDLLKQDYLHIHSKSKPKGMISSLLNSQQKTKIANNMFRDCCNSYIKNDTSVQIPYIITEYCWRIIEEDLNLIRAFLMEQKAKHAVFNYKPSTSSKNKRVIQDFCQEVNAITTEKMRIILSWFNKPSYASPSADIVLLLEAVVSEVQGQVEAFNPEIKCSEINCNINGGLYFSLYDALYVLIYNAAHYGKKDGKILFDISKNIDPDFIELAVTSEVARHDDFKDTRRLIENALSSDCSDANVIEGRSGIKKLKHLENEQYISNLQYEFIDKKSIKASFRF
mgnify:CR=1 FL=1